ncbi:MAG: hypothetical protein R3B45_10315 [Bdellovibrionota bacterium]
MNWKCSWILSLSLLFVSLASGKEIHTIEYLTVSAAEAKAFKWFRSFRLG